MLHESQRLYGSQENQKGCPYILLLSLGQKVHILMPLLPYAVLILHVYSYAQYREGWPYTSNLWFPVDISKPDSLNFAFGTIQWGTGPKFIFRVYLKC